MFFKTAQFNRVALLKILEKLTPKQLSYIPKGYNNHILWNIAHLLVTEQLLTYKLSGLELKINPKLVTAYGKGATPKTTITQKEIEAIKTQLIPAIKQTEKDYKKGKFKTYKAYPTSTGIILNNIQEALQFNTFHEGIHLGIILSIKKQL